MLEGYLGLLLMFLLCGLPQVAGAAVLVAVPLIVASRRRKGGMSRPPGAEAGRTADVNIETQEAAEQYGFLAPTRDLMVQWGQIMTVRALGDELEAEFKTLLDRVLAEDFFNRFGDIFVVLMKVPCYQIVRPGINVVQQMWDAAIKRNADFLICDRRSLKPVMAFLIWLGDGNPPQCGASAEEIESWSICSKLNGSEWEQWIATAMLMSGGIPTLLASSDQVEIYLERPEILLDTIEPYLAKHLKKSVMQETVIT